jgi:hypothetical protein
MKVVPEHLSEGDLFRGYRKGRNIRGTRRTSDAELNAERLRPGLFRNTHRCADCKVVEIPDSRPYAKWCYYCTRTRELR